LRSSVVTRSATEAVCECRRTSRAYWQALRRSCRSPRGEKDRMRSTRRPTSHLSCQVRISDR
jgi:hypothetical protein